MAQLAIDTSDLRALYDAIESDDAREMLWDILAESSEARTDIYSMYPEFEVEYELSDEWYDDIDAEAIVDELEDDGGDDIDLSEVPTAAKVHASGKDKATTGVHVVDRDSTNGEIVFATPDVDAAVEHVTAYPVWCYASERNDTERERIRDVLEDSYVADTVADAEAYIEDNNDFENRVVRSANAEHDLFVHGDWYDIDTIDVPDNYTVSWRDDGRGVYFDQV